MSGQNDDTEPQIDETDRALLALLAADARRPVADLARRLGLARTTVQARIDRLVAPQMGQDAAWDA